MTRREDVPGRNEPDSYPLDQDPNAEHLGVTAAGFSVYYRPEAHEVFRVAEDESGEPSADHDWGPDVSPEDTLATVLEDVGDQFGWESLTEFAEDHLESASGDDANQAGD